MANTKTLTREERKASKRTSRRALKAIHASLTKAQRARRQEEKLGLKAFKALLLKEEADKKAEGDK